MLKISLLFKKFTNLTGNLRILGNKKVKNSGYCFYMNTNILGNFQICSSVLLVRALLPTTNFSYS